MEVTKYYCEVCGAEVYREQFARVECKINFRHNYSGQREQIYAFKRICDKCVEELGFPPAPEYREINDLRYDLSMKDKFMAVAKKLLKWGESENE